MIYFHYFLVDRCIIYFSVDTYLYIKKNWNKKKKVRNWFNSYETIRTNQKKNKVFTTEARVKIVSSVYYSNCNKSYLFVTRKYHQFGRSKITTTICAIHTYTSHEYTHARKKKKKVGHRKVSTNKQASRRAINSILPGFACFCLKLSPLLAIPNSKIASQCANQFVTRGKKAFYCTHTSTDSRDKCAQRMHTQL